MRFVMLVKASKESEAGILPDEKILTEMGKYNEQLVNAGVMLAGEGLHPSSKGTRVTFSKGKNTVTDGPFTETKELVAGYWVIQVKSKEEAVAWARKVPFEEGQIEIRQVFETEDFAPVMTPELQRQEEELRARLEQRAEQTAKTTKR